MSAAAMPFAVVMPRLAASATSTLSMLLLRREFNRRLTFPSQPKLDNTAVPAAMVAAE